MMSLLRNAGAGLRLMIVMTVLLGLAYPLLVLGLGRVLAPDQAAGSLVELDGEVVGSRLIGQEWTDPGELWGRPSAAGDGYDAGGSSGTNLGPNDPGLLVEVGQRRTELAETLGVEPAAVPADAVTSSASGLDPHISAEYAELQVPRIAAALGLAPARVRGIIAGATDAPVLGLLGDPGVNVLEVNVALAELQ